MHYSTCCILYRLQNRSGHWPFERKPPPHHGQAEPANASANPAAGHAGWSVLRFESHRCLAAYLLVGIFHLTTQAQVYLTMSTREKILHLSNTLIQQRGFQGFSYADLESGIGIRKASIHHHFPSKTDLGIAYCNYKMADFKALETALQKLPAGVQRLQAYLDAFSDCAAQGQMCGVYAMLSDSHLFSPELQTAVYQLAQTEQQLLQDILVAGQQRAELHLAQPPAELAMVVSSAIKGALLLNRIPPHEAYDRAAKAILDWLRVAP